jgi:hypothetical protein
MTGAIVSVVLLVQLGMSAPTIWATGITCACFVASLLLFKGREG